MPDPYLKRDDLLAGLGEVAEGVGKCGDALTARTVDIRGIRTHA